MKHLNNLFSIIFKSIGIIFMVATLTVVVITVKSCSQTLEVIEARK